MTTNFFTLFTENEKMVNENLAATRHKNNNFSVLSGSKIWSFKFDHIIKTGSETVASSQPEDEKEDEEEPPNKQEQYVD